MMTGSRGSTLVLLVSLLVMANVAFGQQTPSCTIYVQPGESIQAAIDTAPDGAIICLGQGAWNENIKITKSLTLKGAGQDETIIEGKGTGYTVVWITSLQGTTQTVSVSVEGLKITGAHGWCEDSYEDDCACGMLIQGSAQVTIFDSTISENSWDGILISDSSQATLSNCSISGNGDDGVELSGSAQVTIFDSTISENSWDGILISDSSQAIIANNVISENYSWAGILMQGSCQATIKGNNIFGNEGDGILMGDSSRAAIENNTISDNKINGISIWAYSQEEITGNSIQNNNGYGIYVYSNAIVSGASNHLENNGVDLAGNVPASLRIPLVPETAKMEVHFPGEYPTLQDAIDAVAPGGTIIIGRGEYQGGLTIWKPLIIKGPGKDLGTLRGRSHQAPVISIVAGVADVRIKGLTITGGSDGIAIYHGGAIITENLILGNGGSGSRTLQRGGLTVTEDFPFEHSSGVYMWNSSQTVIKGNTIFGNNGDGVFMSGFCQVTIKSNFISNNGDNGISTSDSSQPTITGNTISDNGDNGILMSQSSQATIVGNKIVTNAGYGVAIYEQSCYGTDSVFSGRVFGKQNTIPGLEEANDNKKGAVCPSPELDFLTSGGGGTLDRLK